MRVDSRWLAGVAVVVGTFGAVAGLGRAQDTAAPAVVQVALAPVSGGDGKANCRVTSVQPERVVVKPGGELQWDVDNGCDKPGAAKRLLKVTEPKPKAGGKPWTHACTPQAGLSPGKGAANQLKCGVPGDTEDGVYKYGFKGDKIQDMDPDIEVRR